MEQLLQTMSSSGDRIILFDPSVKSFSETDRSVLLGSYQASGAQRAEWLLIFLLSSMVDLANAKNSIIGVSWM